MHAIYAFAANYLAWETQAKEVNDLASTYSSIAMKGLYDAVSNYSRQTADGIMAASLLLSWLQKDWYDGRFYRKHQY